MSKNNYEIGDANLKQRSGPRMKVAEKPKNFKNAWINIIKYCRPYLKHFLMAFSFAILSVILTLFGPDNLSKITNMISEGMISGIIPLDEIFKIGILLTLFYLFSALLTYVQNYTLVTVTQKIMYDLRNEIIHKLSKIPLKHFDSTSFGDLLSRITNDADTLGRSLNNALGQLVSAVFMFIGCIFMMFKNNVLMAAIALSSSIMGFFIMNVLIKKSQKHFSLRQRYLGEINGHIEENYAGHLIIKAYSGEEISEKKFDEINQKLYKTNRTAQFMSDMTFPLMEFTGNLSYIIVCVSGAYLAYTNVISFGVIVAFIVYVKLFTQPLTQVAQSMVDLQSAAAASERIFEFLNSEEMEDESNKPQTSNIQHIHGDVDFKNIRFGYSVDKPIIHNFSVSIKAGDKVAIVGPTGAGKTTLVNLLMRFYEVQDGSIQVDGIDLKSMTRENTHDLFCMVLQDSWLFEGTIKENVRFNMDTISDERIVQACKSVGIDSFIQSLPQGYDTVLNSETNISEGQKQLLTIARAMVSDAPILILDEATSSVDTYTETLVQKALEKLTEQRTSFTIAHRLSTIRNADMILVLKDGDIIETGKHEELLEKQGFYAQLWFSQFVSGEAI